MRTQTKIALGFFVVTVSVVILMSVGVYLFSINYSFEDFYKRLEIRGVVSAGAILDHEEARGSVLQEVREMHLEKLPDENVHLIPLKPGQTFGQEAARLSLPVSFFEEIGRLGHARHKYKNTFFAGIKYAAKSGDYIVIVSADNYYNSHHLAYLRNIILVGTLCASALSLAVSFLLSRLVFTPVREITHRVNRINFQNLHIRLATHGADDEITKLESTFNKMLDRLATSFETQNNFIGSASHELSTPLTTIIGEAEVTLNQERSVAEYKESLRSILTHAERLESITKSLLVLARTGFGKEKNEYDRVRADQLLWDAKQMIESINPRSNIQLNLSLMPENPEMLCMLGNETLLQLAFSNVLTNACKFSDFRAVMVSIGATNDRIFIVVKDTGIGIPENELKFIWDPFYRASNSKSFEGYGIGLPLTRNIVRLHNGDITVSSRVMRGTTVQLSFPTAG